MSINTKSCRSDAVVRSGIAARLAEIQERADNATEGPWLAGWEEGQSWVAFTTWKGARDADDALVVSSPEPEPGKEEADAEFIASARVDVPALTNGIESVLDYVDRCEESGITMQPGDIRRLIAAALGGAS